MVSSLTDIADDMFRFLAELGCGLNRPVIFVTPAGVASFDDPRGPWARAANARAAAHYFRLPRRPERKLGGY